MTTVQAPRPAREPLWLPPVIVIFWIATAWFYYAQEQHFVSAPPDYGVPQTVGIVLLVSFSASLSFLGLLVSGFLAFRKRPFRINLAAALLCPCLMLLALKAASNRDQSIQRAELQKKLAVQAAAAEEYEALVGLRTPKLFPHGLAAPGPADAVPLGKGVVLELVLIPNGTFIMGSSAKHLGTRIPEEGPPHPVTLTKVFWMGKYPVTRAQWQSVMGAPPVRESYFSGTEPDAPVDRQTWDEVQAFLAKLNGRQRTWTYRLPTEAEWEFACRAGTVADAYGTLDLIGWRGKPTGARVHPVGRKAPNAFGLYDMVGNVPQWCQDWYGGYPDGPVQDPQGPRKATDREAHTQSKVLRGSRPSDRPEASLSVSRRSANIHANDDGLCPVGEAGFRVVRVERN